MRRSPLIRTCLAVKCIAFSARSWTCCCALESAGSSIPGAAHWFLLTSTGGAVMQGGLDDINSVENPFHTMPKRFIVTDASTHWTHTFPRQSITVIRFNTRL